jgi:hypothetical protein
VIFSSDIIETPQETEQKKRGRERKAPRVSSNKGGVNILRGENISTSKILFDVIPSSPSIVSFLKRAFPESLRKLS